MIAGLENWTLHFCDTVCSLGGDPYLLFTSDFNPDPKGGEKIDIKDWSHFQIVGELADRGYKPGNFKEQLERQLEELEKMGAPVHKKEEAPKTAEVKEDNGHSSEQTQDQSHSVRARRDGVAAEPPKIETVTN